jgi:hypothetical protein
MIPINFLYLSPEDYLLVLHKPEFSSSMENTVPLASNKDSWGAI